MGDNSKKAIKGFFTRTREGIRNLEIVVEDEMDTLNTRIVGLENESSSKDVIISQLQSNLQESGEIRKWGSNAVKLLSKMKELKISTTYDEINQIRDTPYALPPPAIGCTPHAVGCLFQLVPELEQLLNSYPEEGQGNSEDTGEKVPPKTPGPATSGSSQGELEFLTAEELSPTLIEITEDEMNEQGFLELVSNAIDTSPPNIWGIPEKETKN